MKNLIPDTLYLRLNTYKNDKKNKPLFCYSTIALSNPYRRITNHKIGLLLLLEFFSNNLIANSNNSFCYKF